jgi:hypothetical protein
MGCRAESTDPLGRRRGSLARGNRSKGANLMTVFSGDDWAEDHHDVHLMNDDGKKLVS